MAENRTRLSDVLAKCEQAASLMRAAQFDGERLDSDADAIEVSRAIIETSAEIERFANNIARQAERQRRELSKRPRTERQMITVITRELAPVGQEDTHTVKKATSLAGGEQQKAMRRAEGKCELCRSEWNLSAHHIIPRAEGGLNHEDNLIVLCKTCHDDVEDQGYRTRAEVLRHVGHTVTLRQAPPLTPKPDEPTRQEKAQATREANKARDLQEQRDLIQWDKWNGMFDRAVQYLPLGAPEPKRPEKPWHVIVYGAGRHSPLAR